MPPSLARPTRVEIDLSALRFNLQQVRQRVGPACEILAVVKADAYGHGVDGVAPALAAAGADQFGVALVGEGLALRRLPRRRGVRASNPGAVTEPCCRKTPGCST